MLLLTLHKHVKHCLQVNILNGWKRTSSLITYGLFTRVSKKNLPCCDFFGHDVRTHQCFFTSILKLQLSKRSQMIFGIPGTPASFPFDITFRCSSIRNHLGISPCLRTKKFFSKEFQQRNEPLLFETFRTLPSKAEAII